MLDLADEGDAGREDTGWGVLYSVLRDSAYQLKQLAELEKEAHVKKDGGSEELNSKPKNQMKEEKTHE